MTALACCIAMHAGPITKKYCSFLTENGTLYFIRPMHMPKCDDNLTKYGMTFDITYLEEDNDSVSFTVTIVTPQAESLDSVSLWTDNKQIGVKTERLYCEPYKSYYVNRIRFYVKWAQLKWLYEQASPYTVDFGRHLRFSFKPRKWAAESKTMKRIISIIELNK